MPSIGQVALSPIASSLVSLRLVSHYSPVLQQQCPPTTYCPPPYYPPPPDPSSPEAWDYGFHRLVSILQSPPLGAGIIGLALFFLLIFASDILLNNVTITTLGITVTLSTAGFLALVTLILFVV